jgi:hypothetical protein
MLSILPCPFVNLLRWSVERSRARPGEENRHGSSRVTSNRRSEALQVTGKKK